jgi:hypothetical protein
MAGSRTAPLRRPPHEFIGNVASQQHGLLPDLMDSITGLRPHYEKAWLAEYSPYRMATALGRWDAEYENWRRMQARLDTFRERYVANSNLPSFESMLGPWN